MSNVLKKKMGKIAQSVVDWAMGNGLMQEENTASGNDIITPEMSKYARQSGAEGCVLLENNGVLPLKPDAKVAVFGRCQLDWFYVGYGSGGDVHPPYYVNLMQGLANAGVQYDAKVAYLYDFWCNSEENKAYHGWWGHWPMSHPEMPLEVAFVEDAAKRCDTAIVVIGRAAGEDRENKLLEGSYYLTQEERQMLTTVSDAFDKVVVLLNGGNIIDMSWVEEYRDRISALLLVWQGGMESGNAIADVLTGKVNPCGKLADTIAKTYEDYPSSKNFGGLEYNEYEEGICVGYRHFATKAKDRVLYPFGYGLSYTTFEKQAGTLEVEEDGTYSLTVTVTNTGSLAGKEVVALYVEAPKGKLEKSSRSLVAFAKTEEIAPGASVEVNLRWNKKSMASYDDTGVTGCPYAFVLEEGTYQFYFDADLRANSVADEALKEGTSVAEIKIDSLEVVEQCESACNQNVDLRKRILERLPQEIPTTGDLGYKLTDVAEGKVTLEQFVAQLSDAELEALTRGGGGMNSPLGVVGNAGAFGGILPSLRDKGIPPMITADGPAGLRLRKYTALMPCGTALACTWNNKLIEELFVQMGIEMNKHGVDVILSPGMNIHRNPLCGRNFEYFSEDPLLTGKIAAAIVRGVQSQGVSCCPKHFAVNNQETKRNVNDSRLSERTLREIYLRGFEICVKEGKPNTIMTSYNKINGVWAHYNYDLVTTILRKEWGFDGVVVTDWWMRKSKSPEFPKLRDNAYRVRSQVDVLMPGNMSRIKKDYQSDGTLRKTLGQKDGITRGELQRTAVNVLRYILKVK